MGRPKEVIDEGVVQRAEEELKKIKNHKVAIKLQAVISSGRHRIGDVASVMGVSRQTIWVWIRNFRDKGVEGLGDTPKGHYPAKLDDEKRGMVAMWLSEGRNAQGEVVHWTIMRLKEEIRKEFGIEVGKTPLWKLMRKLGFRQKVPRPRHVKADLLEQQDVKKNG